MTDHEQLLNQFQAMPKIELHRHLEGSVRLETLVEVARDYGLMNAEFVDVERLRPHVQMMPGEPRDWQHFLGKFHVLRQFYRSPEIVKRVTREAIEDAAADNIKYLELRFTPQALNNLMACSFHTVMSWVCEASYEAAETCGIQVGLIVSMNRHEGIEIGEQVLRAAIDHQQLGVLGIDLAGQEAVFSARPFQSLFHRARDAGLGITVHAGEWDGAHSVRDAVEHLGAERVGHGIRLLEDPSLIELVIERGIVLEVCPTSNVDSGVVASSANHPLPELYRRGLRTTINTDDPLISNITLSEELTYSFEKMAFSFEEIKHQTLMAAQAAFLPNAARAALVSQFEHWLSAFAPL